MAENQPAGRPAKTLSGADIGSFIADADGVLWLIAEVHHYPNFTTVEIHSADVQDWRMREPSDEVELSRTRSSRSPAWLPHTSESWLHDC